MPFSIIQTRDNNFAFTGRNSLYGTIADVWLQIINSSRDSLLSKTYGGKDGKVGTFIQQSYDNGFVMAGGTNSFGAGKFDAYIIKTNGKGDTLWTQCFGDSLMEYAFSIREVGRNEYIFVGYKQSLTSENDGWIVRFKRRKNKKNIEYNSILGMPR